MHRTLTTTLYGQILLPFQMILFAEAYNFQLLEFARSQLFLVGLTKLRILLIFRDIGRCYDFGTKRAVVRHKIISESKNPLSRYSDNPEVMGCNAVAWRYSDLEREKRLANQRKPPTFEANLKIGLTISEDQTKFLCKEKESCKQEIATHQCPVEKHLDLDRLPTNGNDLEGGNEAPRTEGREEMKTKLDSLEKVVEQNKLNQEKEMRRLSENAQKIKNLRDEFRKRKLKKSNHNFRENVTEINGEQERPNQEFIRIWDKNYCQSYIGQVCLLLQVIMYRIVLPDQFAKDTPYKVKDIEEDIDDEDLLNDEERKEASKRWEDLKRQIRWDPSLERTLEMLEVKANSSMVRPECLTVEEAERAAQELNKLGRLRGKTSYEKVTKIIEMWSDICRSGSVIALNEQ